MLKTMFILLIVFLGLAYVILQLPVWFPQPYFLPETLEGGDKPRSRDIDPILEARRRGSEEADRIKQWKADSGRSRSISNVFTTTEVKSTAVSSQSPFWGNEMGYLQPRHPLNVPCYAQGGIYSGGYNQWSGYVRSFSAPVIICYIYERIPQGNWGHHQAALPSAGCNMVLQCPYGY